MSGGRARAVRGRVPGVAAAARVGCAAQPPVLECAAPASSGRRSGVSAAEAWGPRACCGWRRRPGPQGESQRPEHSVQPHWVFAGLDEPSVQLFHRHPPSPTPPPKLLQQRTGVREGAATRVVAPPRPERPVRAAWSDTRSGGGGGPAGRSWPRKGEGADGRGARRCPGLICRYCGSGGGDRRVGRGRAAGRDRVTSSPPGGWAGGVCGERRVARTPSPVEARPPRRSGCRSGDILS